jgi:hypothetical protein
VPGSRQIRLPDPAARQRIEALDAAQRFASIITSRDDDGTISERTNSRIAPCSLQRWQRHPLHARSIKSDHASQRATVVRTTSYDYQVCDTSYS